VTATTVPGLATSLERLGTETAFSVLARARELEREGREDLLVPLVGDAVRGVDVNGRRIDVNAEFLDAR